MHRTMLNLPFLTAPISRKCSHLLLLNKAETMKKRGIRFMENWWKCWLKSFFMVNLLTQFSFRLPLFMFNQICLQFTVLETTTDKKRNAFLWIFNELYLIQEFTFEFFIWFIAANTTAIESILKPVKSIRKYMSCAIDPLHVFGTFFGRKKLQALY